MNLDRLRRRRSWRTGGGLGIVLTIVASALAVGTAIPPPAAAASSQDWPMFLHDSGRTNATTDATLSVANAPTLAVKWKYKTGGPIATSVSIVGTTAYVGSWDGYEYAINTTNGSLLWKTYLGLTNDPGCNPATLGITSAAAIVNGVLYVGGGDANWYALDPATGAVLWNVFTGDNSQTGAHYNWSSPLIYNGAAYIGVASNCDNPLVQGHLMKVDLASHQVVADYNFVPNGQVGGGIWTSPAVDASTNTIFVSTGTLNDYTQAQSQAIVALDAATLQYKSSWALPFEAAVSDSDWGTTPTLVTDAAGDQLLSVANKNGTLYTLNRNNLAAGPIWQRQVAIGGACPTCGDGSLASGISANGMLYFAGGRNVQNGRGAGGSVSAFDPATGNVAWVHQTEQPIIGSPAYVNGMVAAVAGNTFEVLDASNGALLYSYVLSAAGYGAVSVAYGAFYLGTLDGNLYAFAPKAPKAPTADPNCPTGFVCQDIHNPSAKGSESTSNGVLTVNGSGTGIKGTGDQFRLVSKSVSGDSQVSAQLLSQVANAGQTQQAGLIVRQSSDPASPLYSVLAYPNDSPPSLHVISRTAWSKNVVDRTLVVPFTTPSWLMIQRVGNLFTAAISSDGVQFQQIPGSTVDLELPAVTLQGLAVASGSSTNTGAASFANIAAGGAATTVLSPPPPADACPAPWSCADLGNPSPIGDTTASGSTLNLAGAGTGFGAITDSLHYTYQPETSDTTISAQVVTSAGAKAATQDGLMMRASTLPTTPMYSVSLNPGGSATIRWRVYDGIKYSDTIPLPSSTSPAYLEIARYTDTRFNPPVTFFSTLTSTDGASWSPVLGSTVAIDMGATYLAGVAATSGTVGATTPATFNNVQITGTSTPPPGICPAGFTCSDIGTGIPPGNQIFLNGTWTMLASGNIQNVYDNFRFAYQNFPDDPANSVNGDGTISARVMSQSGGAPSMQSGVMIRAGVDPQAPYYGVFVTPQQNVVVKWRSTQAGATSSATLSGATTPLWVLASRYTSSTTGITYYSAYTSTDGATFTYVSGSQVSLALPQPLVAGIASDANSTNVQSTSVFTNVAQLAGSQPPPVMCPFQWSCTDIGGALPAGQDQFTAGTGVWNEFAGGGDIWGTADSFHLVTQSLPADGTVVARVTAQQPTSPWAKAGPMIRTSTDPGSPYYGVFATPGNGIAVQWRATQGGSSSQVLTTGTVPIYLMIARYTTTGTPSQTLYTSYTSSDGTTWTAVPGSTVTLSGIGSLAGFGITSHAQGTGESVTLDSVAITSTEYPPPGLVCPPSWLCADINSTPLGGQTLSGGAWSIQGGGSDIYGTADQFHYVWNTLNGDGSLSTRAASQTVTSAWAKAGPMLRLSTDPGSPYYAILVTPSNGVVVQWRKTAGAGTNQVQITGLTTPVYLGVTRTGTTFSAATSADGVTWTAVPGSTQSLPALTGALLRGFAVTAHNNTKISTAVFDHVVTNG